MSTFEVLSVLLSCLAVIASLYSWSGQRRLQKEQNDQGEKIAKLATMQCQILEKQALEPLFSKMWRKLHPELDRYISELGDWLARATRSLDTSTSDRLPRLPDLSAPSYENVDWSYRPEAESRLSEVIRLVNSLGDRITYYNQYRLITSEDFAFIQSLPFTENSYDVFGGEVKYTDFLRRLCSECGIKEGQRMSDLRDSSHYKKMLERSHQDMRNAIEALSGHVKRFRRIQAELNAEFSDAET